MQNLLEKVTINTELQEVKYLSLPKVRGDLIVSMKDDCKIKSKTNQSMEFIFTRSIELEPKAVFHIEVNYLIILNFKDEYKRDVDADKHQELIDYFSESKNMINVVNKSKAIGRTSALIADLTTHNNFNPLITPPIFIDGQK